jgi:hypothetical protein
MWQYKIWTTYKASKSGGAWELIGTFTRNNGLVNLIFSKMFFTNRKTIVSFKDNAKTVNNSPE